MLSVSLFKQKIALAEKFRPANNSSPEASAKRAMRSVARRWRFLDAEAKELRREAERIIDDIAPQLIVRPGVGYETAGQLLVTAGDNPERLHSEKSFAALCASTPVKASTERTKRHRLNRGGDRQATHPRHHRRPTPRNRRLTTRGASHLQFCLQRSRLRRDDFPRRGLHWPRVGSRCPRRVRQLRVRPLAGGSWLRRIPAQANRPSWTALQRAGFSRHGPCQPPDEPPAWAYVLRRPSSVEANRSAAQ